MARLPDLVSFAQKHGLKIGTISDLISYRRRHDNPGHEPAASLDPRLGREVVELLLGAAGARGAAALVSLHALELLDAGFDRVVALREGRLHWQGAPAALTRDVLRELYGAEYRALHLDELELEGG